MSGRLGPAFLVMEEACTADKRHTRKQSILAAAATNGVRSAAAPDPLPLYYKWQLAFNFSRF